MRAQTGKKLSYLSLLLLCLTALSLQVNAKTVKGLVVDKISEKPIPDAVVMLIYENRIIGRGITDSLGVFVFNDVIAHQFKLKVRRLGYWEIMAGPFLISKLEAFSLLIQMEPNIITLEEITVIDKKMDEMLIRNGFYDRKELGFGKFLYPVDLKDKNFDKVAGLIARLPGIIVREDIYNPKERRYITQIKSLRHVSNESLVQVYVDGFLMEDHTSLNYLNPYDIAAVEYYAGGSAAPSEYGGGRAGGVLLIWTKR